MSIPVDLDRLAATIETFGFAYLLTVSDDLRAHAVSVTPGSAGGVLTMGVGRRSAANAQARPNVSLVWPPAEAGGYSLIVDGDATVVDQTVTVHPATAVLHRPAITSGDAPAVTSAGACGADCQPI